MRLSAPTSRSVIAITITAGVVRAIKRAAFTISVAAVLSMTHWSTLIVKATFTVVVALATFCTWSMFTTFVTRVVIELTTGSDAIGTVTTLLLRAFAACWTVATCGIPAFTIIAARRAIVAEAAATVAVAHRTTTRTIGLALTTLEQLRWFKARQTGAWQFALD